MSDQLHTIATFNFATDPDFLLFCSMLEQAEIEYLCPESNQIGVQPFGSLAFGGLRVQVYPTDVKRAQEIYADMKEELRKNPPVLDEEDLKLRARAEAFQKRNAMAWKIALAIILGMMALSWLMTR